MNYLCVFLLNEKKPNNTEIFYSSFSNVYIFALLSQKENNVRQRKDIITTSMKEENKSTINKQNNAKNQQSFPL